MIPIKLDPKPSRLFLSIMIALHVVAILAVGLSHIPLLFKLPLGVFVVISGYYYCYSIGLQRLPNSIIRCIEQDGEWVLYDRQGREQLAVLRNDTLITPFLIILNFRLTLNNRRKSLVLFKDALSQDTFRQLKVSLYLKKKESRRCEK